MNFRTVLILINVAAIAGLLGFIFFRVLSIRRNPETTTAENLTPFFDDEVLESAHLERVLGIALIALVIVVLGLLAYFIWEPFRETSAATGFNEQSIQRGAVLFANDQSPDYDSTVSLQCANCHGVDGGGGAASFTVKSEDPRCDPTATLTPELAAKEPYCLPKQVAWRAPALTLAGLRYSADQLTQIITYGRPGTPMPAWGIASGKGVLQEQGIQDLVNYVESLTVKSSKAQADAAKAASDTAGVLAKPATKTAAAKWVATAEAALATAQEERAAQTDPAEIATYDEVVAEKQQELDVAKAWEQTTRSATPGQIEFMNNCARCHTRGWSYFDPKNPDATTPPGPMGGGAYGPNLTNGDVNRQFPPPNGEAGLFTWISAGVPAGEGYGSRGISSGRMPHFGAVLTKAQIEAIMAYERSL